MQQRFLLQILSLAQLVSVVWCGAEGYVSALQDAAASTPDQQLENHSTKYHRQQPPYNILDLLMMSIVMPETC